MQVTSRPMWLLTRGGLFFHVNYYERCLSKPPKSYHLKIIPSTFSNSIAGEGSGKLSFFPHDLGYHRNHFNLKL